MFHPCFRSRVKKAEKERLKGLEGEGMEEEKKEKKEKSSSKKKSK